MSGGGGPGGDTYTTTAASETSGGFWASLHIPEYVYFIVYVAEAILIICILTGMVVLSRKLYKQSQRKKQKKQNTSAAEGLVTNPDDVNRLSDIWTNDQVNMHDLNAEQAVRILMNQIDNAENTDIETENPYAELDGETRDIHRNNVRNYESVRGPSHLYESVNLTTFQRRSTARAAAARQNANRANNHATNDENHNYGANLQNGSTHYGANMQNNTALYQSNNVPHTPVHSYQDPQEYNNHENSNGRITDFDRYVIQPGHDSLRRHNTDSMRRHNNTDSPRRHNTDSLRRHNNINNMESTPNYGGPQHVNYGRHNSDYSDVQNVTYGGPQHITYESLRRNGSVHSPRPSINSSHYASIHPVETMHTEGDHRKGSISEEGPHMNGHALHAIDMLDAINDTAL